jgi:hypothetical protein
MSKRGAETARASSSFFGFTNNKTLSLTVFAVVVEIRRPSCGERRFSPIIGSFSLRLPDTRYEAGILKTVEFVTNVDLSDRSSFQTTTLVQQQSSTLHAGHDAVLIVLEES